VTEFLEPPVDRVSTEKRATPASVSPAVPVAKVTKETVVSTDWMVRPDFVVHLAHLVILDNKVTTVYLDPLVRQVLRDELVNRDPWGPKVTKVRRLSFRTMWLVDLLETRATAVSPVDLDLQDRAVFVDLLVSPVFPDYLESKVTKEPVVSLDWTEFRAILVFLASRARKAVPSRANPVCPDSTEAKEKRVHKENLA